MFLIFKHLMAKIRDCCSPTTRLFTFLCLAVMLDGQLCFWRLLADAVLPLVSGIHGLAVVLRRFHLFLLVRLPIFVAIARDHLEERLNHGGQTTFEEDKSQIVGGLQRGAGSPL